MEVIQQHITTYNNIYQLITIYVYIYIYLPYTQQFLELCWPTLANSSELSPETTGGELMPISAFLRF